jgi:hypothetical protein
VFFSSGECTALSALERIRDAVDMRESRRQPGCHSVRSTPDLRGEGLPCLSPRSRRAARDSGYRLNSLPTPSMLSSTLCLSLMLSLSHPLPYDLYGRRTSRTWIPRLPGAPSSGCSGPCFHLLKSWVAHDTPKTRYPVPVLPGRGAAGAVISPLRSLAGQGGDSTTNDTNCPYSCRQVDGARTRSSGSQARARFPPSSLGGRA